MPARNAVLPVAVTLTVCISASCRCVTYYRSPPVTGLRFFASSARSGSRSDTLYVTVSGRNASRAVREIELTTCSVQVHVRAIAVNPSLNTWDSVAWWNDSIARVAALRKMTPDGHPILRPVCTLALGLRTFAPGDSGFVSDGAFPVRAILGDSLPPGRYRIQAQLKGSGQKAGYVSAGEVELRTP